MCDLTSLVLRTEYAAAGKLQILQEIVDQVQRPDSRVIDKDDAFASNTIFHSNCRGIWVAILQDEEDPPKIGGIPQAIRDRFGDVVNDLIQPKKPQRKKR